MSSNQIWYRNRYLPTRLQNTTERRRFRGQVQNVVEYDRKNNEEDKNALDQEVDERVLPDDLVPCLSLFDRVDWRPDLSAWSQPEQHHRV